MNMKISVVTINFNDLQGLKKTVNSVFEQTYPDIQYILIDGNSTDGSKQYLQSLKNKFDYFISEKDKGIYDAMNKGIVQIKGSYVLFLNSGDTFYNTSVLNEFVKHNPLEDIVYGDAMLHYRDKEPVRKYMPDNLEGTTIFTKTVTHQAMFYKASVFRNKKYDLRYSLIADWVLYNTIVLLNNGTYRRINIVIVNYDMTGLSSAEENKELIKKERNLFYKENADYFNPLLQTHKAITLSRIKDVKRPFLIRFIIKGLRKLNLYK